MSSHLQLYLDRAFSGGCDTALEKHAADALPKLPSTLDRVDASKVH